MKIHVKLMVLSVLVVTAASDAMGTPLFSNQRSGNGCGGAAVECTSFQIDDQTAATSNVNTQANVGMAGLAYDANNDILYGIKNGANSELFTIDQASGASTSIGNTGINDAVGLAYDNANNTLWTSTNGSGGTGGIGQFHTLNVADGSALSNIAGFQERLDGLAYGNGNLYAQQETGTGTIFVVNQTTGAGTAIANQALPNTGSWQGLAFQNGMLYAADCCAGGNGELWSVDPTTGATASVGSNDTFRLQSLASTVPEPTTLVLLGLGAIGMGLYGRRRRR